MIRRARAFVVVAACAHAECEKMAGQLAAYSGALTQQLEMESTLLEVVRCCCPDVIASSCCRRRHHGLRWLRRQNDRYNQHRFFFRCIMHQHAPSVARLARDDDAALLCGQRPAAGRTPSASWRKRWSSSWLRRGKAQLRSWTRPLRPHGATPKKPPLRSPLRSASWLKNARRGV